MGFNIEQFRANIATEGYLHNNNFEVLIATPPKMLNTSQSNQGTLRKISNISNNMRFRIDQIRAPGINIQTSQLSRYGIGPVQNMPINAQYQDFNFSLICDEFGEYWQYWHNWLNMVFGFNGKEGAVYGNSNDFPTYQAEYKDNYSTTVLLLIYDHFGNIIQKINLLECFPTSLREVPLSWGDAQMIKLNVAMSYTGYVIIGAENETPQPRTATPARALTGAVRSIP